MEHCAAPALDILVQADEQKQQILQTATQTYLEDPIWDRQQQGMAYTVVFKDSSVILSSQEELEGCPVHQVPLAVRVPMNPEEIVPEGAFVGVSRLQHVSVESDIRLIGAIREDQRIATGLRFVHWCHASPNVQARQKPKQ